MIDSVKKFIKHKIFRMKNFEKNKDELEAVLLRVTQEKENQAKELDRLYKGCISLNEEINFLKFRNGTLKELHYQTTEENWNHDGSLKKYCCIYPFNRIEILENGEIYNCCSGYIMHDYYIGNIYKDSLKDVWNSDKVKKLRFSVASGNFEFCNRFCRWINHFNDNFGEFQKQYSNYFDMPIVLRESFRNTYNSWKDCTVKKFPEIIQLTCDPTCNLKCPSCRSHYKALSKEKIDDLYNVLIEKVYPLLQDCKLLCGLMSGEFFASRVMKRFYQHINKKNWLIVK
ncbi:SPASM domain-containing protein [Pectinatus haikarae]|uniref:SPASM domain-containing protein n=1 Tax=Pectinatus haikarae TaxID=349096 RepID=UPI0018C688B6|nr:SPASM domain-containing protein [Pectinatus haikarae]